MEMLRSIDPNFRSGSKDSEFLVSIVDEAHALINPEHSEGRGQFGFTTALGPQAYHIIRSSTVSVFLFDPRQGFRDRENTTVSDIKRWSSELGVEVVEEIRGAISCHTARQKMELIVHRALLAVALRAVMKEAGPGISPGTRLRAARALAAASAPEAQG